MGAEVGNEEGRSREISRKREGEAQCQGLAQRCVQSWAEVLDVATESDWKTEMEEERPREEEINEWFCYGLDNG